MLSLCSKPGKTNVVNPFNEMLFSMLPDTEALYMEDSKRLFWTIACIAAANIDKRPCCVIDDGTSKQYMPLVFSEDVCQAVYLMESSNGIRPYVSEYYDEAFLPAFRTKTEQLGKKFAGLTVKEVSDAIYKKTGKVFGIRHVRDTILGSLVDQGIVNMMRHEVDKREWVYAPVRESEIRKLMHLSNCTNSLQQNRIVITNPSIYPDKEYITTRFTWVQNQCGIDGKIRVQFLDVNRRPITIEELVSYYEDSPHYFEKGFIVSESQEPPQGDVKYSENARKADEKLVQIVRRTNYLISRNNLPWDG